MQKKHIPLYTTITGNTIGYDTYTFGGGEKKLYIQGGVHGGEITYFIFEKIAAFLQKHESELTGEICLAPLINPRAWDQRIYYYTAGKFDWYKGKDWNRSYLGNPTGDLSSRMSDAVFSLASHYPLCIDLHTARESRPYVIYTSPKYTTTVRTLGLPYALYAAHAAPYVGSFIDACDKHAIESVAIECGSHDSHNRQDIDEVTEGLIRLIQVHAFRSPIVHTAPLPPISIYSQAHTLYAHESGFIEYLVRPRDVVTANTPLYRCIRGTDITMHSVVTAKEPCTILELAKTHIATIGDELIRYVSASDCTPT